jgi:hypothetical protein
MICLFTGALIVVLQGLLVVVLLITIGINIMFILDTSRRLHDEVLTTGEKTISDSGLAARYCFKSLSLE